MSVPDVALGNGLKYSFVEDSHKFETDGATLRYSNHTGVKQATYVHEHIHWSQSFTSLASFMG
jgi:hypothetical protein